MSLYALALEITILLAVWLALAVWQRDRSSPGRRTFIGLCLASALWGLGELAAGRELLPEVTADRIKYAGALALPPLWLGLAAHAARLDVARRVPWFPLVLLAPGASLYALLYSATWSSLFLVTVPGGEDLRGPLWAVGIGYSYLLIVGGCAVVVATAFRWPHPGQWGRRLAIGVAPLLPLAGHATFLRAESAWVADPTPILLGIALLALRSGIFAGGLLEALGVSQQELIHQLPLGVVLTDRQGTVLDMNPAAERRLGLPARDAAGRSFEALLRVLGEDVNIDVSPVIAVGREAGRLILLDPLAKPLDTGPTGHR